MTDDVGRALARLAGGLPQARLNLSEDQKDQLIAHVGPRTARDIVKAKRDYPLRRIPFLFASVDTQAVVDLLANNMEQALARAFGAKSKLHARG